MKVQGRCHCGEIAYEADGVPRRHSGAGGGVPHARRQP